MDEILTENGYYIRRAAREVNPGVWHASISFQRVSATVSEGKVLVAEHAIDFDFPGQLEAFGAATLIGRDRARRNATGL